MSRLINLALGIMLTTHASHSMDEFEFGTDESTIAFDTSVDGEDTAKATSKLAAGLSGYGYPYGYDYGYGDDGSLSIEAQQAIAQSSVAMTAQMTSSIAVTSQSTVNAARRSGQSYRGDTSRSGNFTIKSRFAAPMSSLKFIGSAKTEKTYQDAMNAMTRNGPVNITSGQTRIWVSPFTAHSRVSNSPNTKGRMTLGGALLGAEKNIANFKYKFGLMAGLDRGSFKATAKNILPGVDGRIKGDSTDVILGVYHSGKPIGQFAYNISYFRTITDIDSKRDNTYKSSFHTYTDTIDADLNYRFRFCRSWFVRPLIGHTYTHIKENGFKERTIDSSVNNPMPQTVSGASGHTSEVYGGFNFGNNWSQGDNIFAFQAGYEFGYEYDKSKMNRNVRFTSGSGGLTVIDDKKKNKTHYVSLSSALHHKPTLWSYALSYTGGYTKNKKDHVLMMRVQKSF